MVYRKPAHLLSQKDMIENTTVTIPWRYQLLVQLREFSRASGRPARPETHRDPPQEVEMRRWIHGLVMLGGWQNMHKKSKRCGDGGKIKGRLGDLPWFAKGPLEINQEWWCVNIAVPYCMGQPTRWYLGLSKTGGLSIWWEMMIQPLFFLGQGWWSDYIWTWMYIWMSIWLYGSST